MANPTSLALEGGNQLIAGWVITDQVKLAADTYYPGMPLKYSVDGTVVDGAGNTGTGTVTAVTARSTVPAGEYTLTMTAALVAQLTGPGGAILADSLQLADGNAAIFNVNGLQFTVTDGGTAFVAADSFAITIGSVAEYEYNTALADAIYNGPTVVLSTAGYGSVIKGGEIWEAGLVDSSGDALTITETMRAAYRNVGFYLRRKA